MNVTNWHIYNLENAIVGSGLPMLEPYDSSTFADEVNTVVTGVKLNKHVDRAVRLATLGSPHCNFLTGILVVFNITGTQAFFLQAHRYHWWQVVSSQSKMHRLKKMLEKGTYNVNTKVKSDNIVGLQLCNREDIEELVYNCPMGFETTEMVSTNYMQLRTIYAQRHDHRLQEWKDFCFWIETLPLAQQLLCVNGRG